MGEAPGVGELSGAGGVDAVGGSAKDGESDGSREGRYMKWLGGVPRR
jgi:hypothetical protein